jgi:phage shock protein A
MSEHERQADRLERELDDMQEQSDRLEDEIDETRSDWERKKRDPNVPGAAGDPDRAEEEPKPETDFPSKGD